LNDLIQTRLFTDLTRSTPGSRKIPATDGGIAIAENTLRGCLTDASVWFIDGASIEITVPTIDVTDAGQTAERAARKLTGLNWSARLQGAYEEFVIQGVVYP